MTAVVSLSSCGSTPPAPTSTPPPVTSTSTPAGEIRLNGVVTAGVEPQCLILDVATGSSYLLLGGDRSVLVPGRRVVVLGQPQPDTPTTCQQGTPFKVRDATPAS